MHNSFVSCVVNMTSIQFNILLHFCLGGVAEGVERMMFKLC